MSLERVLIVDDEPLIQRTIDDLLKRRQIVTRGATTLAEAESVLAREAFDLVMLDVQLPDGDGHVLLERIIAMPDHPLVVMITGYGSVESAVKCMRTGAFDYLIKPFRPAQIDIVLKKASNYTQLLKVNRYFTEQADEDGEPLIGRSPAMQRTRLMIQRVAPTDATVLITGENGSGKEMIAREIYRHSPRRGKPYIKVNCAALSEQLIESELFGHERGAFTGATERREGRFELAHQGTLLLDEVSEIPLNLQAKLLRVLQERELERVGGTKTIKVNVRILATSNRNLQKFVERGLFRSDLYYRLNVFPVSVPSLRERPDDIETFASSFLRRFTRKHGLKIPGFSDEALAALIAYPWPGNVRELQNTIERSVILSENHRPISTAALNLPELPWIQPSQEVAVSGYAMPGYGGGVPPIDTASPFGHGSGSPYPGYAAPTAMPPPHAPVPQPVYAPPPPVAPPTPLPPPAPAIEPAVNKIVPLADMERQAIQDALAVTNGNRTQAAEMLGISIRTMRNKLKEYREAGLPGFGPDDE